MHNAIDVAPLGPLADPQAIIRLARAAEAAGWDGISIWDSLGVGMGTSAVDPFVALAGVAAATQRLRLIVSVAALPRRRPQLVAQAAGTLDRLSGGRLVLGIGMGGDPADFEAFGDPFEARARAAMFDEGAALVDGWLRGERPVAEGPTYRTTGVGVGPAPVQSPRPPIWLGGMKPGALRRAAHWDGWIALATTDGTALDLSPDALAGRVEQIRERRALAGHEVEPFDIALFAFSDPGDRELRAAYAAAGATWWLESLSPMRGPIETLLERVEAGPD